MTCAARHRAWTNWQWLELRCVLPAGHAGMCLDGLWRWPTPRHREMAGEVVS